MRTDTMAATDEVLAGLDALDSPITPRADRRRGWITGIVAIGLILAAWQLVVASGWRPTYILPGPATVLTRLWLDLIDGSLLGATATTARRAATGYFAALFIVAGLGLLATLVTTIRAPLRAALAGLQSMPSIAWFPFAVLLFGLNETAIIAVVMLGAAPAIAEGFLQGVDRIPRITLRAAEAMGARGWRKLVHVTIPAAIPGFTGGLSHGWAFAWRSLMAGEMLVTIGASSLGVRLHYARELADAPGLLAAMLVVLLLGGLVEVVLFRPLNGWVRNRYGMNPT